MDGASRKLIADIVLDMFTLIFSEKGSNSRAIEEAVMMQFVELLHEIESEFTNIS